jgi:hypothetical protein
MSPKADGCSGYSGAVLRYLVDAAREVSVPAGVLLWDEDQGRIWFRLPREGERIAGVEMAAARSFLSATQATIESWQRSGNLPYAKERLVPLSNAWWDHLRGLLQWSVRLGPVWALAGEDPEEELEAFYERSVQPQFASRERRRRLESAVEAALGPELAPCFQRDERVSGFGGRRIPVLGLAADDQHLVILEAVNLAAVTAERDADALASRLACIREGENSREIRFVLGYLGPAKEGEGERALKTWIEHGAGTSLFDLEEEAEAFRAAAAAALVELGEPLDGAGITAAPATAARSRRTVRSGRRKAPLADAPAVG